MKGFVYLIFHECRLVDIFVSTQSLAKNALDYWLNSKLCPGGHYAIAVWLKGPKSYNRGDIDILFETDLYSEVL